METLASLNNNRSHFEEMGFLEPVRILDARQCRDLSNALRKPGKSLSWPKGRAADSRLLFELASDRKLLDILEGLIGPDINLFAASIVSRQPGQIHPWHTDIETAHSNGNAISVWIGLENTNANSSLQVVSRSHSLGETIQQFATTMNVARSNVSIDEVTGWARSRDPQCAFVNCDTTNGMAIIFDGRLWHGSDNTNRRGTRTAVLLQYARPDFPARIPDSVTFEWPFAFQQAPKPPCIMVRGNSNTSVNEFVPPPDQTDAAGTLITKWVRELALPLARNQEKGSKYHPVFSGRTRVAEFMSCHVSVLEPGQTPHPPHHHTEEEILIMLDGEADLVSVQEGNDAQEIRPVSRGDFAYYPAGYPHTITNSSDRPATYLMFKWLGRSSISEGELPATYVNATDFTTAEGSGLALTKVMEGPTRYLRKLHCHKSTLAPGGGYEAHVDAYDVAIVILDGAIEIMGEVVDEKGVVYFSAGELHDMQNAGDKPANYLVFEFHSEGRLTDMGWEYNAKLAVRSLKRIAKRLGAKKLVNALRSIRR